MQIGLLGMGTVGGGVKELAQRLPDVHIARVLERVPAHPLVTDDPQDVFEDENIHLIIETMGGLEPAYAYARRALESGRHLVTANKLLVSVYGRELHALARRQGVGFLFGAACGGGIPYLSNLCDARQSDDILRVGGILNGTTNYMLDAMRLRALDYDAALREAQALDYAERDPSSDVQGLDTLRKLVLAVAVGMRLWLREEAVPVYGIEGVTKQDMDWAARHGYALRLCARAERSGQGLHASVEPTMCPRASVEASVGSNLNLAWYEGAGCGMMRLMGQGAGRYPTAANVLRDVHSLQQGARYMLPDGCKDAVLCMDDAQPYYVRLPSCLPVPAWARQVQDAGPYRIVLTGPVSPQAVYALKKQNAAVFFARLEKEQV